MNQIAASSIYREQSDVHQHLPKASREYTYARYWVVDCDGVSKGKSLAKLQAEFLGENNPVVYHVLPNNIQDGEELPKPLFEIQLAAEFDVGQKILITTETGQNVFQILRLLFNGKYDIICEHLYKVDSTDGFKLLVSPQPAHPEERNREWIATLDKLPRLFPSIKSRIWTLDAEQKAVVSKLYLDAGVLDQEPIPEHFTDCFTPPPTKIPKFVSDCEWTSIRYYVARMRVAYADSESDYAVEAHEELPSGLEITADGLAKSHPYVVNQTRYGVLAPTGQFFEIHSAGNFLSGIYDAKRSVVEMFLSNRTTWRLHTDELPSLLLTGDTCRLTEPENRLLSVYFGLTPTLLRGQTFSLFPDDGSRQQVPDFPACTLLGPDPSYEGYFKREGVIYYQKAAEGNKGSAYRFQLVSNTTIGWLLAECEDRYWCATPEAVKFRRMLLKDDQKTVKMVPVREGSIFIVRHRLAGSDSYGDEKPVEYLDELRLTPALFDVKEDQKMIAGSMGIFSHQFFGPPSNSELDDSGTKMEPESTKNADSRKRADRFGSTASNPDRPRKKANQNDSGLVSDEDDTATAELEEKPMPARGRRTSGGKEYLLRDRQSE